MEAGEAPREVSALLDDVGKVLAKEGEAIHSLGDEAASDKRALRKT